MGNYISSPFGSISYLYQSTPKEATEATEATTDELKNVVDTTPADNEKNDNTINGTEVETDIQHSFYTDMLILIQFP